MLLKSDNVLSDLTFKQMLLFNEESEIYSETVSRKSYILHTILISIFGFLSTCPYWKYIMTVTLSLGNRKGHVSGLVVFYNFSFPYSFNFFFFLLQML